MLVACGDDRGTTEPASTPASTPAPVVTYAPNGEVMEVVAIDNNFLPQALTVAAGTEVKFANNGRNDHNVVPEGDLELTTWGVQVEDFLPGDTYSYVFTTPGTYVYYCTIHGTSTAGMFGSIEVTAP